MSVQFQLRRGTYAQIQAITPAAGEILYCTDRHTIALGDGAVVGGYTLPTVTSAGYVGIGTSNPTSPLVVTTTLTDVAFSISITSESCAYVYTANNANQINMISLNNSNFNVPAGVIVSGGYSGLRIDSFINTVSFAGTMTLQNGIWSRAGILLSNASAVVQTASAITAEVRNDIAGATITSLFGIKVTAGTIAGNVTNYYGIFVPALSVTGTITNRYGIRIDDTASYNYLAGKLGIGAVNGSFPLYVNGQGAAIQAIFTDSDTDATTKTARIGCGHYLNAEEKVCLIYPYSDATTNTIGIGGGTSAMNAATNVMVFCAANNTTPTGTQVAQFTITGLGLGNVVPTTMLDINANNIRIRTAKTPASSADTGTVGTVCWDASYVYVCTATNTWKRAAIATW